MTVKNKLTAAQVKSPRDLPPRLLAIGREIETHVATVDKAADAVAKIKALLIEAQSFCDAGGFAAFRRHYCPSLGRSKFYKLLSIARGSKSAKQIKAAGAARQARHIAKLKAAAVALRKADQQRPSLTNDSTPFKPLTPAHGPRTGDNLHHFTGRVLELILHTASADPAAFVDAKIGADDLRALADFLLAVANHKTKTRLRVVR